VTTSNRRLLRSVYRTVSLIELSQKNVQTGAAPMTAALKAGECESIKRGEKWQLHEEGETDIWCWRRVTSLQGCLWILPDNLVVRPPTKGGK
jgi:hypothetical protein